MQKNPPQPKSVIVHCAEIQVIKAQSTCDNTTKTQKVIEFTHIRCVQMLQKRETHNLF